ncbi:guanylate-binding protein 7-like [Ascaphus truei]|uniref:guanylate-binding protein 7-like n=1 Tax=Ascaphus truei TaxID=8439 RepID=UPI003F599897
MAQMKLPMCLIENQEGGEIVVNQDVAQILSDITQPVVVVAIVGKYRTGKSYLMNKLAGRSDGFALGSTVQSKTKGIWMWCVPHPSKPGHTLVLLDTEGLGDVEKGDSKNDAWIFSLAVLLSSTLVYNSVGTIDQQAMEQLHYVTELTERIKVKSSPGEGKGEDEEEDESTEFKRIFPSFIWCIRDFNLKLELDGKPITEDEYLQNALKLKKGTGKKVTDYNLPRECIRHFFHSHKCFVFDRPASKANLQRLEELQESDLEPEFVKEAGKFCTYVYQNSKPKTLSGGHTVTGRWLGNLAVTYVEAIRSGSVPCMENAVLALAQIENSRAVQEALCKYDSEMSQRVDRFPTETQEEFLNLHQESEKEAVKLFMNQSFKDENQEHQKNLIEKLAEKRAKYSQRNEEASAAKCRALIQDLSVSLERGISEGEYTKPGGHQRFVEEKQKLVDAYNGSPGKGIKALEVLQEFLIEKEKVGASILQADKSLSVKDKEIAEQRAQAEAAEREKQILEENNRRLEQLMGDQERSFAQQQEMLMEKMEEDRKKMIQENDWMITEKLKEQAAMLNEGFKRNCEMLEDQIRDLREQNASRGSWFGDLVSAVLPGAVSGFVSKLF